MSAFATWAREISFRRATFATTSSAFAVLGLRPPHFMLAGMMRRFVYLQTGLSVVLVFVGVKS